jgi:hypothetical protein
MFLINPREFLRIPGEVERAASRTRRKWMETGLSGMTDKFIQELE